jgi:hypothetical protein
VYLQGKLKQVKVTKIYPTDLQPALKIKMRHVYSRRFLNNIDTYYSINFTMLLVPCIYIKYYLQIDRTKRMYKNSKNYVQSNYIQYVAVTTTAIKREFYFHEQ